METLEQARETIYKELISTDSEVHAEYLKLFEADAKRFSEAMARAVVAWRPLDNESKDEKRGYVAALSYAAISLHVVSFKLFLSGHIVAAGNLFRQVIESIALALLCSGKDLGVLDRFIADKYSSNHAVDHVLRAWDKLGLKPDAAQPLKDSQSFYHKYSHISRLTLANLISFSEPGIYVGASFDNGKIEAYKKEVAGRVNLAETFEGFIEGLKANVGKWNAP
ncbi:MAG: hypothetical protein AB7E73_12580 [Burkholderiales bacterium]